MKPKVTAFFDRSTYTVSYVVADPGTDHCVIIDSVLDYEASSGRTSTLSADKIIHFIRSTNLTVDWVLETHIHADHLTAAPYLRSTLGGRVVIGSRVVEVQKVFSEVFNEECTFRKDGMQFDQLLADSETLPFGNLTLRALSTPGHTPSCMTYVIGDCAFVGDTLFMPDYGTARTDFPGGDAATLYRSIQKIFSLPEQTRLFMCHDYKAPNRDEFSWETTVAEQRASNVHIHDGVSESDFVKMREARDATLGMPRLIIPSIQINMRAGEFPPAEDNGTRYLKTPLDTL